jgi:hypothetical protein
MGCFLFAGGIVGEAAQIVERGAEMKGKGDKAAYGRSDLAVFIGLIYALGNAAYRGGCFLCDFEVFAKAPKGFGEFHVKKPPDSAIYY